MPQDKKLQDKAKSNSSGDGIVSKNASIDDDPQANKKSPKRK